MCEKVKMYITAQQIIHMKPSMDCCVGVYYSINSTLFHPLHVA
jgi:hypothetical protein